jgi:dTDP-4-amino-4,6-dideoxygalactose transaminase
MIGNFGEAEVFSFHATKFFNTFEGGAVVTNNDELAKKLRLMKNYGFNGFDSVIYIGTNGKMSEICAAMGLTGLESIQRFIDCNYANYQLYRSQLSGIRGVRLVQFNEMEKNNFQYVILELDDKELGLTRDQMIELLHAEKILARRYFYPGCHKMEPYRSYFPHAGLLLPETEQLTRSVMALPTGQTLGLDEIQTICDYIHFLVDNSGEISLRMASIDTASEKR